MLCEHAQQSCVQARATATEFATCSVAVLGRQTSDAVGGNYSTATRCRNSLASSANSAERRDRISNALRGAGALCYVKSSAKDSRLSTASNRQPASHQRCVTPSHPSGKGSVVYLHRRGGERRCSCSGNIALPPALGAHPPRARHPTPSSSTSFPSCAPHSCLFCTAWLRLLVSCSHALSLAPLVLRIPFTTSLVFWMYMPSIAFLTLSSISSSITPRLPV